MASWINRLSLSALFGAAEAVKANQSNHPGVRDLEAMLQSFEHWKKYYSEGSRPHRERAAKLELIGDKDADYERRQANSHEEDAARLDVGIRALTWAIGEIRRLETETGS